MASMQMNPLHNFGGSSSSSSSSTSTSSHSSSSTTSSSIINIPHPISIPNGLPSGLSSVTITPTLVSNTNMSISSNSNSSHTTTSLVESSSVTITKSNNNSHIINNSEITIQQQQQQQQQQQLRALASSLQSMTTNLNLNNINNSNTCTTTTTTTTSPLNQTSLAGAASKLIELNPMDDIMMQEVTQRLFKMNQDLWQQAAGVSVAAAAAAAAAAVTATAAGIGNHSPGSSTPGVITSIGQSTLLQRSNDDGVHEQVNEMKIAEKLVNELAVQQQSTRNTFHLNERTLQDCWNTLQRVSCMIFMHKSAMQLQQQQQQQQQVAAAHRVHHVGNPIHQHGLIRAGSVSSVNESENGTLSKQHKCHQCLKSFSSNHQLVQHLRVHTGEKPYKCSYCERRFKQLSHVQQHTRLHTGERPYKCHVHECGRAFIQLSNLQQHLRNHDAQLERSKNRPFHCNICGKGFATESSLRTHTTKVCKDQHAALIGGPNAVTCPICHKLFLDGETLMEHMKHTHKDPNASGVATKRRTANHPCPICGKHYVNEGSLRKHLTCHPEAAQLTSSLRMWPCSVCQAVFTHENGLLTHMEQMRMDPKHQFAAQYVLSRAAAERRERDNILTAAAVAAMTGVQNFGTSSQGQPMPPTTTLPSLMPILMPPPSPSGSESSGRLSSPLDTNSGLSSTSILQAHTRLSSPTNNNAPLDARINTTSLPNPMSHLNNHNNKHSSSSTFIVPGINSSSSSSSHQPFNRKDYDKYDTYEKLSSSHSHSHHHQMENNISAREHPHHSIVGNLSNNLVHSHHHPHHHHIENGTSLSNKFQVVEQAAMKMAQILRQGHGHSHTHSTSSSSQNELTNFIQQQHLINSQLHNNQDNNNMMSTIQTEPLVRSQTTTGSAALRVVDRANNSSGGTTSNNVAIVHNNEQHGNNSTTNTNGVENHLSNQQQQQQQQQHEILRGNSVQTRHNNSIHHASLNHQLNSIMNQQDLSEVLLRQIDGRTTIGFPLSAHNS